MSLYKGTFNYQGEVHEFYAHAKTVIAARNRLIQRLAKSLGRTRINLYNYFILSDFDNYKIEEERDENQVQENV